MKTRSCAPIAPASCTCTAVVPRGQFDWIRENLAQELHVSPQLTTYYYGFNLDRPLFRDVRIRRALSLVIDRERLASSVLRVGELPAYGWVPPGIFNYASQAFDYAAPPMPARIAEAQALLAAAGYTRDKPLSFELRYNNGEVHTKVAVAVASMWKEALGVDAQLAGGRVQIADAGRRPARRRCLSALLGRRLQRPVHLSPVPQERLRHQPAALQEWRL